MTINRVLAALCLLPLIGHTVEAKDAEMKIVVEAIDHSKQRYPTAGDYWRDKDGTLHIVVSKMADHRYEFLVAIHELVEAELVLDRKIPLAAIDKFDRSHPELDEPGDDPRAPYHAEHMVASEIERRMAKELGVDWAAYEKAIAALDP